jgi:hypothetical protein
MKKFLITLAIITIASVANATGKNNQSQGQLQGQAQGQLQGQYQSGGQQDASSDSDTDMFALAPPALSQGAPTGTCLETYSRSFLILGWSDVRRDEWCEKMEWIRGGNHIKNCSGHANAVICEHQFKMWMEARSE